MCIDLCVQEGSRVCGVNQPTWVCRCVKQGDPDVRGQLYQGESCATGLTVLIGCEESEPDTRDGGYMNDMYHLCMYAVSAPAPRDPVRVSMLYVSRV